MAEADSVNDADYRMSDTNSHQSITCNS
jgi:hypothetical protein